MNAEFDRAAHCRRIARLGGLAKYKKVGSSGMSAMGVKGFRALAKKFRSVSEAKDYLRRLGVFAYVTDNQLPDTGKFDHHRPLPP